MTTVLEAINEALHSCMAESEDVFVLGEDILDPYGGAFKVSRGLSTSYPDRVIATPISEAGFIGIGVGMAVQGLRPIVEIMFGDFLTLGADQLINYAAKMRWMSADQVRVPLVVRTPMGGRRGYGPTHSQSLEKHFMGAPGLRVVALNHCVPPADVVRSAVLYDDDPVLLVEHKLLYGLDVRDEADAGEFICKTSDGHYPVAHISLADAPKPILTIAAYGYALHLAMEAVRRLGYEYEVFADIIAPTQLSPAQPALLAGHVQATGRLLTVEEAPGEFGWGSELIASLALSGVTYRRVSRVSAEDMPIPASGPLEGAVLPQVEDIVQAALALM